MRHLFFAVLATALLAGCVSHGAVPHDTTPTEVAVEPQESDEYDAVPAPDPLAELNAASQELVITTHYLRHWSRLVRRHDEGQLWGRGFTAWLHAVDRWLSSASRLSREARYGDANSRLSVMLDMERHLADMSQAQERMELALLRLRNSDIRDAVTPQLTRAIRAIEQAEQALYNLENPDVAE